MFDDIIEVQEAHYQDVNTYLSAGYRLLSMSAIAKGARRPDGTCYTRKFVVYVVGRTAAVPAVEVPVATAAG